MKSQDEEKEAVDKENSIIDIKEGSPPHVVFLTSDFAMQNVIM